MSVREGAAWGKASTGMGGERRGGRPVPAGEAAWGKASASTEGERRGCRPVPADAAGDGGEGVMGERADPFFCSIRFDEENGREG